MGAGVGGDPVSATLGIDPGLSGAIAVRHLDGYVEIFDMPTFEVTIAGKKRRRLDGHKLAHIIEMYPRVQLAVLENVHSMPKQGVASSFSFGEVFGSLKQCLVDHSVPYRLVEPAGWKRYFGITHDKDSSRQRASQLMPKFADLWSKKSHDGRAEAALLALYGSLVFPLSFSDRKEPTTFADLLLDDQAINGT